jgi:hypothetical protein
MPRITHLLGTTNLGTEEQWEDLDRLHVDPEHAARMIEHLMEYIAQTQDCPMPVRMWLERAYAEAKKQPGSFDVNRWVYELGFFNRTDVLPAAPAQRKRGGGPPRKAGLQEVVRYMRSKMNDGGLKKGEALRVTAAHFGMTTRTVRSYLDQYDRAMRVDE